MNKEAVENRIRVAMKIFLQLWAKKTNGDLIFRLRDGVPVQVELPPEKIDLGKQ